MKRTTMSMSLGHRHLFDGEFVAVDQCRVPCCRGSDAELIHDPRRNAGCGVFGAPRCLREFERSAGETERPTDRALQRRAGRESGTCRDVGDEMTAETAGRPEFLGHAGDERSPLRLDGRRVAIERESQIDLARPVGRRQLDRSRRGGRRERDAAIDRHRKREAAGVVGVLADQIHTPGRMDPERGLDIVGHRGKRTARTVRGPGLSKGAASG